MLFSTLTTTMIGFVTIVSAAATGKKHFDCEYTGVFPESTYLLRGVRVPSHSSSDPLLITPQTCRTGQEYDAGHCEIPGLVFYDSVTGRSGPMGCDYQYRNADHSPCFGDVRHSSQFAVSNLLFFVVVF
jgi:hypothetical protein